MLLVFATILDLNYNCYFSSVSTATAYIKKGQTYLQNYNGNVLCFYHGYFFSIQNKRGI